MTVLSEILNNYAQFFSLSGWIDVLDSPADWAIIFSLVILEGLLSSDNALVLAIMVKRLPEEHGQRKKALFYGLWGAYAFRFLAIGIGTFLIKMWYLKAAGAAYLLYLSGRFFVEKFLLHSEEDDNKDGVPDKLQKKTFLDKVLGQFWATICMVELMDVSFSVDSIIASLGVSQKVIIVLIGGMLGILMMRGVAQVFLALIEHVPELENTAYILIMIISLKMFGSLAGFELSQIAFFIILIGVFGGTIVFHYLRPKKESSVNA